MMMWPSRSDHAHAAGAIRGLVEDMLKCTDVTVEQIKSREKHQTDVFLITWALPAVRALTYFLFS